MRHQQQSLLLSCQANVLPQTKKSAVSAIAGNEYLSAAQFLQHDMHQVRLCWRHMGQWKWRHIVVSLRAYASGHGHFEE